MTVLNVLLLSFFVMSAGIAIAALFAAKFRHFIAIECLVFTMTALIFFMIIDMEPFSTAVDYVMSFVLEKILGPVFAGL